MENSSQLLEKVEKVLSKSKRSNISTIKSSIEKLKSDMYFKSNTDISNDLEDIIDHLITVAEEINPEVKTVLFQKLKRFTQKIDSYIEEYSKIESEMRSLKRKKACKESIEESFEIESGPVKVKTSKKPKKEINFDNYMGS